MVRAAGTRGSGKTPWADTAGRGHQIKSLGKAIGVLDALAASRVPLRVTDLAQRLHLTPSTTSRLVATLREHGLVDQDEATGRCYIGLGMVVLGNAALGRRQIEQVSHPWMAELSGRLDEYVNLSRLHRGHVIYLRGTKSDAFLRAEVQLGAVLPVHCTAPGKALIAWLPRKQTIAILRERGMERFTANTITTIEGMLRELENVRRTGIAYDREEIAYGTRGVAAPIRDHTGAVIATLSIGAPAERLQGEKLVTCEQALVFAARAISREMGYLAPSREPGPSETR